MSFDRLIAKIIETKNPTVAGLDPKLDYIPVYIKEESYAKYGKNLEGVADALLTFNKALIDALCDIVPMALRLSMKLSHMLKKKVCS